MSEDEADAYITRHMGSCEEIFTQLFNEALVERALHNPVLCFIESLLRMASQEEEALRGSSPKAVRATLLRCSQFTKRAHAFLEEHDKSVTPRSTRSGYLHTLEDLIGPAPSDRTWRDEWVTLNLETAKARGWPAPTAEALIGEGSRSIQSKLGNYPDQVQFKTERGWSQEDAEVHTALSGVCGVSLCRSIEEHSKRYAASVHAVNAALVNAAQLDLNLHETVYNFVRVDKTRGLAAGSSMPTGGLAIEVSDKFETIDKPDANGFRGFTCPGEVPAFGGDQAATVFHTDGMPPRYHRFQNGQRFCEDVEGVDVVAFVPKVPDAEYLHQLIETNCGGFRAPPNTLITFLRYCGPGEWEASNGVRPRCGCFFVTVTFRRQSAAPPPLQSPTATQGTVARIGRGTPRMLANAPTLAYADRTTYARGLREIEAPTPLTLAQEWQRDERWTSWDGQDFSAAAEYAYVCGTAGHVPESTSTASVPHHGGAGFLHTFAGVRDERNGGKTLHDFVECVNVTVQARAERLGLALEPELHLLTDEETVALRLYTGPGYQVLNTFLREMGKLSEPMRRRLACSPEFTYAATTRAICSAIRKLARVNRGGDDGSEGGDGDGSSRWRGVRGQLPAAFFQPGALGEVVATELGMMSTSTTKSTPVHYMHGSSNVLWELRTRPEDEHGYHQGADVSMVSQFPAENEELFPPLTMLSVRLRAASGEDERFRTAFAAFDTDSSGTVTAKELKEGLLKRQASLGNAISAQAIVDEFDLSKDGELQSEEFTKLAHAWLEAYLKKEADDVDGLGGVKSGDLVEFMKHWQADLVHSGERKILCIVVEPTFV